MGIGGAESGGSAVSANLARVPIVDVEAIEVSPRHDPPVIADVPAERAVLAAALLDPVRAVPRIEAILAPSDFYDRRHATLWEVFLAIRARGDALDVLTVGAELRARNRLNAIGGAAYLGELTDEIPTIAHCETHARIVHDTASRRRLGFIGERLQLATQDPSRDPEKLRDAAIDALRSLRFGRGATASSALDLVTDALASIENGVNGNARGALPFNVSTLDVMSGGGMKRGGSYFIAARPGVGKTACASQIGGATAASGECVLYVALEPSRHDIMQSTIANRASVNLTKLTRAPKTLSQVDLDAVWGVANAISSWPLHVVDAHEREVPDTVARIENVMRSLPSPPALVIVDHLLKLQPTRRYDRQHEGTAEVVSALVSLGKRTGATMLTLCHIGRGVRASSGLFRRPCAEDIAGGDAMNRDADGIIIMHREDKYPTTKENVGNTSIAGMVDLLAPKLRGVEDNTFGRMKFRGEVQRFEPIEPDRDDQRDEEQRESGEYDYAGLDR